MNQDEVKETFLDVLVANPFDPDLAQQYLERISTPGVKHPFMEEEMLERDYDYDLLGYCCTFGTLPALRWVLRNKIMGPEDVDVSLYTAAALTDDLVSEENLRYLLTTYGVSFEEICFGDLDEDRQELVRECLPSFDWYEEP